MDSNSLHPFIPRDMRLVLFCNNCSGKQVSSDTYLMTKDVSVVEFIRLKGPWFYTWGTRSVGKSFEGQAQEKAGPQGQSLEGASPREDNIE